MGRILSSPPVTEFAYIILERGLTRGTFGSILRLDRPIHAGNSSRQRRKCLGFKTPFQAILKELGKDVQIRFS
jgi:hypothetical protein